jgi:putative Ca2+/H+ antiporter (TMEM165/GDT1 family)
MMIEMLKAFFLIFIAEMGDKTQILAMAFATRFPVKKVLAGVFIGVLLNHGLGVIVGKYISDFLPTNIIQIVAGVVFISFAFWTLKVEDDEDKDEEQKYKFGPVLTVALAFFIGELGDKTQLTAITLATNTSYPLAILGGTVLGMIMTCSIGILIGKKLGDKVPEFIIKIIAAFVFMAFGIAKLYQNLPQKYINFQNSFIFIAIIFIIFTAMLKSMLESRKKGVMSRFKQTSKELFDYYNKAKDEIEKICLGEEKCGKCQGDQCIVGYTKTLINTALEEGVLPKQKVFVHSKENIDKPFEKDQIINILKTTLKLVKDNNAIAKDMNVNQIRKNLEKILLGRSIEKIDNWGSYTNYLYEIDEVIAKKIFE